MGRLYGRDPGLFVDQIEDVGYQGPSGGVEIDPQGTRGRRDDDRKRRESMRRAHVEWNDHEPGKQVLPARAENDFRHGDVRADDVTKHEEEQPEDSTVEPEPQLRTFTRSTGKCAPAPADDAQNALHVSQSLVASE